MNALRLTLSLLLCQLLRGTAVRCWSFGSLAEQTAPQPSDAGNLDNHTRKFKVSGI